MSLQTSVDGTEVFMGEAYDFSAPCWQVKLSERDCDYLNRQEQKNGKDVATSSARAVHPSGGSGREGRNRETLDRREL